MQSKVNKTPHAVIARIAKRRSKLIAAGLCIKCGHHPAHTKTLCGVCADRVRVSAQEKANKRFSAGLCIECGNNPTAADKKSCSECLDKAKAKRNRIKWVAFQAYGGAVCSCCGEKTFEFLTLDHINNDGGGRYRKIGGAQLYAALNRRGFPAGFRVLCFNCNAGRHIAGGVCPHELKRQRNAPQETPQFCEVLHG